MTAAAGWARQAGLVALLAGCSLHSQLPPADTAASLSRPEVASSPLPTDGTRPMAIPDLRYPASRRGDQVDTYHGVRVADPYRWLEDDNAAETQAWVRAQNALTESWLAATPQRQPVHRLYAAITDHERHGIPFRAGARWFWTRADGLQAQPVLYTGATPAGPGTVLLDPNALSADGTVALTRAVPSRDGRLLAYGLASAGSDWQTWHVRDLDSGRDLPEVIRWVKFTRPAWTADGRGFFYGRYAEPRPGEALTGTNAFQKLYYHRIGTPQEADLLVAEAPQDGRRSFGAWVSEDGRWLVIPVWQGSGRRNGLMALPLPGGAYAGGPPQVLTMAFDAEYEPVTLLPAQGAGQPDRLVLRTRHGAPMGRLVTTDLAPGAPATWRPLVSERADALESASAVGGALVLRYLRDASAAVRVHAADGRFLHELVLPGIGSASGFEGRLGDPDTCFAFSSPTTPSDLYRYEPLANRATRIHHPKAAFDADRYETRRAFVTSRDGTRFPVFISQRKGLVADGRRPTLLYGYGGFNVPVTPTWSTTAATWMAMGGVYVSASIRGGGEYGEAWHRAGTRLDKQNVFDDFIAAAQWLIDQRITSPSHLAIQGGSNGGLLVGAVVNQRPDLFAAAVPAVGVMDMLRYHRFTIGWAWAADYGTAEQPDEFRALQAYSPLHNIRPGVRYPAVLVTTGDHDDRVVPAHSFKYTAALQAADTGPAPKLIRVESQAGHGAGKPTAKLVAERADMLAFIAHAIGMPVP